MSVIKRRLHKRIRENKTMRERGEKGGVREGGGGTEREGKKKKKKKKVKSENAG